MDEALVRCKYQTSIVLSGIYGIASIKNAWFKMFPFCAFMWCRCNWEDITTWKVREKFGTRLATV